MHKMVQLFLCLSVQLVFRYHLLNGCLGTGYLLTRWLTPHNACYSCQSNVGGRDGFDWKSSPTLVLCTRLLGSKIFFKQVQFQLKKKHNQTYPWLPFVYFLEPCKNFWLVCSPYPSPGTSSCMRRDRVMIHNYRAKFSKSVRNNLKMFLYYAYYSFIFQIKSHYDEKTHISSEMH